MYFDKLRNISIFATLNYYHIPIAENFIDEADFITPDGIYEFLRMIFELYNALSMCQRIMNTIIKEFKSGAILC